MNLFIIIYYAWLDLLNSIAEKEEEGGTIDAENRAFNYLQENGTWIPCSLPASASFWDLLLKLKVYIP